MTGLDEPTTAWLIMQLKPDRVEAGRIASAAVETGALCHLRCPFCRTGNGTMELDKEFLDASRFGEFLEALGPSLKFVAMLRWGEPLLNPRIYDILALAASQGVSTLLHSSLSLPAFDAGAARRLVRCGLTELTVSCDGATQRTYQQYRVGGRLSLVLRNIELILEARRAQASKTPLVRWQFLVHRGNRREIGKARRMARRLGVGIEFRRLWAPDDWAVDPAQLEEKPPEGGKLLFDYQPCLQAWDMPGIHSDGTVLPCCVVTDRRYALGNVLSEPIEAIWNKPLIVAMRRYLRAGIKPDMDLPCYACPRDPNKSGAREKAACR